MFESSTASVSATSSPSGSTASDVNDPGKMTKIPAKTAILKRNERVELSMPDIHEKLNDLLVDFWTMTEMHLVYALWHLKYSDVIKIRLQAVRLGMGFLIWELGFGPKLAWELGFGPKLGWDLGFGTPPPPPPFRTLYLLGQVC